MATISGQLAAAIADHQAGRLQAAEQRYRQILADEPDHAEAWNLLGVVMFQCGQHETAIEYLKRAICLQADAAKFHNNLGTAYQSLCKWNDAAQCYTQALALDPNYAAAMNNLGAVLEEQGRGDEAVGYFHGAIARKPDFAEAYSNLGAICDRQRRLDDAVACHRRAIELAPRYAKAYNNLGNALRLLGQWDEAAACYERAIELQPTAKAHDNLAALCEERGDYCQAIEHYKRALEINPDSAAAQMGLVHASQHVCDWSGIDQRVRRVLVQFDESVESATGCPVSPFSVITLQTPTTPEQQLRSARRWVRRHLRVSTDDTRTMAPFRIKAETTKITLGYLSADFHEHATAWLMAELFEKHDRDQFRVFGYSYGPDDGSAMRGRLCKAFDRFVDVTSMSHDEAARQIAADGVDILVDLKGYTKNARSEIMALRPAAVQVNYLGYPGTMGAPFIDYILVDDFVVPAEQQPFFSERLVHLPGCYQVNDSRREIAAETPTRAECGLPEHGFVFCSFNSNYKITPEMFDVWMRLLAAVPDSVLWLYEGNSAATSNLRREAVSRGVAAERLVFAPHKPLAEHLARYRLADLFLDTFPVTAHTTASDALWAGCPLLTLVGETLISRVAGSLLRAVGLSELAAETLEQYEDLALGLATDRHKLLELRTRLAANRQTTPLFDAGKFARNVERAYTTMHERSTRGQAPIAFSVAELEAIL